MIDFLNDGTKESPKLRIYLNLDTLLDLRPESIWPDLEGLPRLRRLADDGFEGVQTNEPPVSLSPIPHCGSARIDHPKDADTVAATHKDRGDSCVTVHVGTGLEDDRDSLALVGATLAASERHSIPIFIETHRATITQDVWRTVQITKQFPEVRFNADFSHYYTGLEMVYGDWDSKLAFMDPIFERTRFIHGRIGSPGCMQVAIGDDGEMPHRKSDARDYVSDFKELWTRAMRGFLQTAKPGDYLVFCPELLRSGIYYAREFLNREGRLLEESDRYQQALLYQKIAQKCFQEALAMHSKEIREPLERQEVC